MEIKLTKKPKNPIIIEGFPGFGLVATISTEFLTDHLQTELIGSILPKEASAMVAIHEANLVHPIGIYYNKKYNIIVIHSITVSGKMEWEIAEAIAELAKKVEAKEIISLEGVGSPVPTPKPKNFFYTKDKKKSDKFTKAGLEPLKEGIIMGVTAALLVKNEKTPMSCILAETHSELPDAAAAAKVVEALDKYLNLSVDTKPLMKQAAQFEEKLKGLLTKGKQAQEERDKKQMSYIA